MRAILYARYSTGNQSPLSTDDQLRLCRELAQRMGAHVVREFVDPEISGFDGSRPQFNRLLDFVRAGGCDLVIAEHSNRIARDGEKGWHAFNLFKRLGVRYVTVVEGTVTVAGQAVSTLVSELKGEETSAFTWRGLRGVVEAGRSGGGLTYGYRVKRAYDERGEPIRGLLEIDAGQADIVRRILRDYAAGASPLAIAAALNAEAVPGPRGGPWNHTTIAGSAGRGTGIIHNELYVGVRVWGRRRFVKDRASGARAGRMAETPPIRVSAPELRIVDDGLWAAVQARHAAASHQMTRGADGRRLGNGKRPKRFLSGLIRCGLCGGPMTAAGPKLALRCATRAYRKGCDNTAAPGYRGIEARVAEALRGNLLHPDVVDQVVLEIREGLAAGRRDSARVRGRLSAELADVRARMGRLVDQVEAGAPWKALAGRHAELEARADALEAQIAQAWADRAAAGPADLDPAAFRRHVEALLAALDGDPAAETAARTEDAENAADRAALRQVIQAVRFMPRPGHGQYDLEIEGDLAPLLAPAPNANGPLAGAVDASHVMREVGAGTRVVRRHSPGLPFRIAA